ncbi:GrpB family protein [Macrococcoides canis]|uniref:GrpB family protein n=1 Tax=Macrococcoides canis TaxID=1855823 RepID=UPI00207C2554|nr:GrpB family protein [Macrococcus canis]MCO4097263.1 GrpB family protein [Macrococcus canis]UTH08708.1 GrpB family protein [Macrococcus canis]
MRKLEICEYDSNWKEVFDNEKEMLREILFEDLLEIYHIGSTSVPNLYAKPIIDILIVVKDIKRIDKYNEKMSEIGYLAKGENGIINRRYFEKGGDHRTHHVHIYEKDDSNIIRHIAFRDYLLNKKDVREQYNNLKLKLLKENKCDIENYINGKHDFVQNVEKDALKWYQIKNKVTKPILDKQEKVSVYAFIIDDSKKLLTYSMTMDSQKLIRIPGGGVKEFESLEEALFREIKEETGFDSKELDLLLKLDTLNYYKKYIDKNIVRHDYLLKIKSNDNINFTHRVTGNDGDANLEFNYNWLDESQWDNISEECHLQLFNIRKMVL